VKGKSKMPLTLEQIRENNARARQLLQRTRDQHFAVGAFNIDNQETLDCYCQSS
jgi:hypothetical protein